MIKQAGILLTLCATSLVVINIRTLETVETSPDDRPALIDTSDTCLVARWAGYPAAFSSSWGFFADLEMADGAARTFSRYNLTRQPTQRPTATSRPTSITCPRLKEITNEEDCPDEVRFFSCDNPSLQREARRRRREGAARRRRREAPLVILFRIGEHLVRPRLRVRLGHEDAAVFSNADGGRRDRSTRF